MSQHVKIEHVTGNNFLFPLYNLQLIVFSYFVLWKLNICCPTSEDVFLIVLCIFTSILKLQWRHWAHVEQDSSEWGPLG